MRIKNDSAETTGKDNFSQLPPVSIRAALALHRTRGDQLADSGHWHGSLNFSLFSSSY
jgi:hypothetical protein